MVNKVMFPKAYSEVYSFLNALGIEYIKKIPKSIYNIIERDRDVNYNPKFDPTQKINNSEISKEALSLISALNLQYWCKNEQEKTELKQMYINNTKKEDEKYSYENLFKNCKQETVLKKQSITNEIAMVECKKSIFKKFVNKIKSLFHLR